MKKHTIAAAAALALASMLSMPAHSQDHDRHHGDHGDRGDRGHMRDDHMRGGDRHDGRDEWQRHEWRRGERVPSEYRNRQYVVEDWRGHRLNRPPRGYQWVQVPGGDYALIAIGSGVIANIVIGH